MNCIVCSQEARFVFEETVLYKHLVKYYKCSSCGQMQTEEPYWLGEAYQTAITSQDIGLLERNISLKDTVYRLAIDHFDTSRKMLDFGGGYGILVRLLRDKGLDFYRQDIYCDNIFAVNHDITDLRPEEQHFELLTCFEVFEHTYEPIELFESLTKLSAHILVSTLLVPETKIKSSADWWYISPETGQHVAFYTLNSLEVVARRFNLNLYSNGENLHLFTTKIFAKNPLVQRNKLFDKLSAKWRAFSMSPSKALPNLIERDLQLVKERAYAKKKI